MGTTSDNWGSVLPEVLWDKVQNIPLSYSVNSPAIAALSIWSKHAPAAKKALR